MCCLPVHWTEVFPAEVHVYYNTFFFLPQSTLENFVGGTQAADVWQKRLVKTLRKAKMRQPINRCKAT